MKKTYLLVMALGALCGITQAGQATPVVSTPAPATSWTERESLIFDGFGEDSGFTPTASWAGEYYGVAAGGAGNGSVWTSLFTLGAEQEVGHVGSIGFTSFIYNDTNHAFGDLLGTGSGPSSNIAGGNVARFFEIYYNKEIETGSGNFTVRLGQLAADETFMGLDFTDAFLNTNWGCLPTMAGAELASGDMAYAQYCVATLGGVVSYEYENVTMSLGLYNGNAGQDVVNNDGFDYKLEGMLLWYQVDVGYELGGQDGFFRFGLNHHTGDFENIATGNVDSGITSYMIGFSQNLSSNEDGDPIIGTFARVAWTPDDELVEFTFYADWGLNWFAPFESRPDDVAAIGVSTMKRGTATRNSGQAATTFDTFLEMTYRFQVTNFMTIQPNAQIFFDAVDENGERNSAFVLGARAEITF